MKLIPFHCLCVSAIITFLIRYCNLEESSIDTSCTNDPTPIRALALRVKIEGRNMDYMTASGRLCTCHQDKCNVHSYMQMTQKPEISLTTTRMISTTPTTPVTKTDYRYVSTRRAMKTTMRATRRSTPQSQPERNIGVSYQSNLPTLSICFLVYFHISLFSFLLN